VPDEAGCAGAFAAIRGGEQTLQKLEPTKENIPRSIGTRLGAKRYIDEIDNFERLST
jgi:hypothetical protein